MTTSNSFRFLVHLPAGLRVRGTHDAQAAPVHPDLLATFLREHVYWRERVASRPGEFEGHRAVLLDYHLLGDELVLHTGYRTYTEGQALRDALSKARDDGFQLPPHALISPTAPFSWGFALNTFVLLPQDHVLCAQRSRLMAAAPGVWTPRFSEIIEPGDIAWRSMSPLLDRLCAEELPGLQGMGEARFVGLGVDSVYTWVLVSLLDLRSANREAVLPRLEALQADDETVSWGVAALHPDTVGVRPYPDHLYRADSPDPGAMDLAHRLLQECSGMLGSSDPGRVTREGIYTGHRSTSLNLSR